jgi:hypothetical protein
VFLLLVGIAHATPPRIGVADPAGVEFLVGAGRMLRVARAGSCSEACEALERATVLGGSLQVQLGGPWGGGGAPPLRNASPRTGGFRVAGWLEGARSTTTVRAAAWEGQGWQAGGGIQLAGRAGGVPLAAWGGALRTQDVDGVDARAGTVVRAGAAWAPGRLDDGASAWLGAESDVALGERWSLAGGRVDVPVTTRVPVRAVMGATLASDPLGGPAAGHGRILAVGRAWAGAGWGVDGALGWRW